jgi:CubicO group peptidase (beta-lactamase class C family)
MTARQSAAGRFRHRRPPRGPRARAALLGLLLCASLAPRAARTEEPGRELDVYFSRLEALGFSGTALVQRGPEVILRKGYGWADKSRGRAMTADDVVDLGSITKQFTAAAILRLEADGKLGTGDPITRFFKDVPPDKSGITLHHLLTHSAGLASDFAESDYEPVLRDEYVRRALASALLGPPGKRYAYSNAGFSLLAAVVELVSGKTYEAYLADRLFRPAGMTETGYKLPGWPPERIAHGYSGGDDWGTIISRLRPPDAPYWALRGNGGIHSTPADVARWHEALATDRVLPAAARRKLTTPYIDEDDTGKTQYAYGWVVERTSRGTRDIWHNGGNGIYSAELHRYVDEGVLVFVASTVAELNATPAFDTVQKIVFGEPHDIPPAAVRLSSESLKALAGRYHLDSGGDLTLEVEGESLTASLRGADAYAAWYGVVGEARAGLRALDERTGQVAGRALEGDYGPLVAAVGNAAQAEEVRRNEVQVMEERRSRLGAFRSHEVLGTAPVRDDVAATDVRLDFERGSVFNRYVWRGDRLLDVRAVPRLPALRLVPQSERELVAFDLRRGTGPRLRLEAGGSPLRLVTSAGERQAQRVR